MKEASMPNYVHNFAAMLVCATSVSLPAYAFHPADDPLVLDVRLALAGVNFENSCAFDADAGDSLFRWTEWVVAATTVGKRWAAIESARAGKTLPKEILARNLARQIVLSNKELWERWLMTDYGWKVDPFRNAVVSVAKNGEITVDPRLASMDQYKAYGLILGKTYLLPCDPAWVDGWSGMVHEAEQQLAENLATVRAIRARVKEFEKDLQADPDTLAGEVVDFVREVRADADNILTKTVPGDAAYDAVFELRGQLNILEVFGLAEMYPQMKAEFEQRLNDLEERMVARIEALEERMDDVEAVNEDQDNKLAAHDTALDSLKQAVATQAARIDGLEQQQADTLGKLPGQFDRLIEAVEKAGQTQAPPVVPVPASAAP
jgi:uncharacterized coiled-coil protein SlyX